MSQEAGGWLWCCGWCVLCWLPPVVLKATQSSAAVHGAETVAGPTNKLPRVLKISLSFFARQSRTVCLCFCCVPSFLKIYIQKIFIIKTKTSMEFFCLLIYPVMDSKLPLPHTKCMLGLARAHFAKSFLRGDHCIGLSHT